MPLKRGAGILLTNHQIMEKKDAGKHHDAAGHIKSGGTKIM